MVKYQCLSPQGKFNNINDPAQVDHCVKMTETV